MHIGQRDCRFTARRATAAGLLLAAVLLAGCGDPRDWFGPRVVEVQLTPSAMILRPGESRAVRAMARYSDGSLRPIENLILEAVDASPVDVEGSTVTARRPGLVSVAAQADRTRSHALVLVTERPSAAGPLRRDPATRRYFVDRHGQAVYLTGSHNWIAFQDSGLGAEPPRFDFDGYLDALDGHGHNFIRLWRWEQAQWVADRSGEVRNAPMPYLRTGPGLALDGRPRFDLEQFEPAYFERLRARVAAAGKRGLFVGVMLFNGWSLEPKGPARENPWRGHPFHRDNNVNRIDGDPLRREHGASTHVLGLPEVLRLQEAYVRRVVETLNDLDNVLYEISNESSAPSIAWQRHMVAFIREVERGLPRQHPVGISAERPGESNDALFGSGADWIAPFRHHGRPLEPFAWHGDAVMVNDTDHLCGVCGSVPWAWRALTRGQNPIMMDPWDVMNADVGGVPERLAEEDWAAIRRNMGWSRLLAEWIDPATAEPYGGLVSSGYGLARLGQEPQRFVVYLDEGGKTVRLFGGLTKGSFGVRWLDTATGRLVDGGTVEAKNDELNLSSPVGAGAVLLLEGRSKPR